MSAVWSFHASHCLCSASLTPSLSFRNFARTAEGQLKLLALVAGNVELAYVSCATAAHAGCTAKGRLISSGDLARTLRGNRALALRTMTRAWNYLLTCPKPSPSSGSSLKALFGKEDGDKVASSLTLPSSKASTEAGASFSDETMPTKRQKKDDFVAESFWLTVERTLLTHQLSRTVEEPRAKYLGVTYTSLLRHHLPTLLLQTVMVNGTRNGTAFADLLR